MCGIFGTWHLDGSPLDIVALRRATDSLRHRGPDDEGYLLVDTRSGRAALCGGEQTAPELALPRLDEFVGQEFSLALGFRRLSILDLSPAGHQPMPSADGSCWLVFNGEIYNYIELRSELTGRGHMFKTGTDSEVILAAYQEWGPECLQRFNGMWGMAIWDSRARRLFLARDRLGVKPLYYVSSTGTFAFASEIKALLVAGAVPFEPSASVVAAYVAQGRSPSGDTFFEGVKSLSPGCFAMVESETFTRKSYWSLRWGRDRGDHEDAQEHYSELFTDSVRLRLRADVPVGTCLSGGLDSSSIVAVAGRLMHTEHAISLERLGEHQQTFSAVYESDGRWNERQYIDEVVHHTGAAGNYVYPAGERLWAELERLMWHQDEPFQSTSLFAQWCVMRLARERGVTVLLDGQGADEVLGGYRPYSVRLAEMLRSGHLLSAVALARDARSVAGVNALPMLARALFVQAPAPLLRRVSRSRLHNASITSGLRPEVVAQLLRDESEGGHPKPNPYGLERNLNRHLAYLVREASLPDLLRYEDRNSMAFSIEARVPFLDYRLVEYAFYEAASLRMRDGWTKWVQRKAVEPLLPSEVVWRRDKVGFETPEQQWLREGKGRIMELLTADDAGGEYLDLQTVRSQAPAMLEQGDTARVWRWVNLVVWLRCFGSVKRD